MFKIGENERKIFDFILAGRLELKKTIVRDDLTIENFLEVSTDFPLNNIIIFLERRFKLRRNPSDLQGLAQRCGILQICEHFASG